MFQLGRSLQDCGSDVSVCVPELSVAVGAVQDIVPVAIPLSVTPVWVVGQPVMAGFSLSGVGERVNMSVN